MILSVTRRIAVAGVLAAAGGLLTTVTRSKAPASPPAVAAAPGSPWQLQHSPNPRPGNPTSA